MRTNVTVGLIEKYLKKRGWEQHDAVAEPGEKEGIVATGWQRTPDSSPFVLFIDPQVERKVLSFRVLRLVEAPRDATPPDRLTGLLMTIAWINYQTILGKFGYDPKDGEVTFQLALPIGDSKLSYNQFDHCLRITVQMVEDNVPKLKGIVDGSLAADDVMARS